MKTKPNKPKPPSKREAAKFHAWALRQYAKAEARLIRAALAGCVRFDPREPNRNEASSSGREIDLAAEIADIRWCRNHLTWAERDVKRAARTRAKRAIRPRGDSSARPS